MYFVLFPSPKVLGLNEAISERGLKHIHVACIVRVRLSRNHAISERGLKVANRVRLATASRNGAISEGD
jgi:ribosomal protein L31E